MRLEKKREEPIDRALVQGNVQRSLAQKNTKKERGRLRLKWIVPLVENERGRATKRAPRLRGGRRLTNARIDVVWEEDATGQTLATRARGAGSMSRRMPFCGAEGCRPM